MTDLPGFLFTAPLPGIDRPLTEPEGELLHKYMRLLIKWQRVHRLIGSAEPAWIVENVFLDSLAFLAALPSGIRQLADVGSGAGIPGIPIAIVRPDLSLGLIEARQRRVSFLSTVARELELGHVQVVGSRVEDLAPEFREKFDAVVMRCAGGLHSMLSIALGLVRPGGSVVIASGPQTEVDDGGEDVIVRTPTRTLRTLRRYVKRAG